MLKETTDQTFEQDTAEGVTLTDVWATWCGPCRMQTPVIEELAEEMNDVKFSKMDADKNPETLSKFGIMVSQLCWLKKMARSLIPLLAIIQRHK